MSTPKLREFLRTTFANNRSSERTDRLHEALLDYLCKTNSKYLKYDFEYEYLMRDDGYGGNFKIDIAGFDKDGNLAVAVLAKCINQNMCQNLKNYANTSIGEACRILDSTNPIVKGIKEILFVDIFPSEIPYFTREGKVNGYEKILRTRQATNITKPLKRISNGIAKKLNITYDISRLTEKTHRKEFLTIKPRNIREIK